MARVYKLKAFVRFQRREAISDAALVNAISSAERGLIDSELGGGLIKQRVAREGRGKRGGYRTVIAYRRGERAVFLYGFAKSDRSNLTAGELETWVEVGEEYLGLRDDQLEALVVEDVLKELLYDSEG